MDTLLDAIEIFIPGDWGNEEYSQDAPNEVICIRGADIENVKCGIYQNIPIRYVSNTSFNKKTLESGDIIIEKSGGSPTQSTGRVCYISDELIESKKNVVCSNFCAAFRMKSKWYYKYIYYYLHNIYSQGNFFNYEGKTSGIRNLLLETAFQAITLPDILTDVQKRTVKILDKIDQKINLNTRMNAELEAMAKQLYDYWFVQFDFPDENGKPYKSSGGKMVYNEKLKREIPEGWGVSTYGSEFDVKLGGTPSTSEKSFWINGTINWLNSGEVQNFPINKSEKKISEEAIRGSSTEFLPKGSVLISITRYLRVTLLNIDACINQSVAGFAETEIYKYPYTYFALSAEVPRLMKLRTGAQQPHINKEIIEESAFLIPPKDLLSEYYRKSIPIFKTLINLSEETEELTHLRDSLLPMLMNGQVIV